MHCCLFHRPVGKTAGGQARVLWWLSCGATTASPKISWPQMSGLQVCSYLIMWCWCWPNNWGDGGAFEAGWHFTKLQERFEDHFYITILKKSLLFFLGGVGGAGCWNILCSRSMTWLWGRSTASCFTSQRCSSRHRGSYMQVPPTWMLSGAGDNSKEKKNSKHSYFPFNVVD